MALQHRCQCEHVAHFETLQRTPNGNPGHRYGQKFYILVDVKTPYGTFEVCHDCATGCYAQFRGETS